MPIRLPELRGVVTPRANARLVAGGQRRAFACIAAGIMIGVSIMAAQPGPAGAEEPTFSDIGDSIFQTHIEFLVDAGITLGCNAEGTLFCPTVTVTREQMASFLVRGLYLPTSDTNHFADDEDSEHHHDDINALAQSGITTGCGTDQDPESPTFGESLFCPTLDVTREQMASFLARALKLPEPEDGANYFDDDDDSEFHENDINKMSEAGITLGCGERLYCPLLPVTREQMAAFLYRALTVELEPLDETLSTAAAALEYLLEAGELEIPASCGGDITVNCTGGTPSSLGPQLSWAATELEISEIPGQYGFSSSVAIQSLQDIPVSLFGVDCSVAVDTAPGVSPTIEISGTLRFGPYDPDGPEGTQWPPSAELNRVFVGDIAITGLEDDDFTLEGGGLCAFASLGVGVLSDFVAQAVENHVQAVAPCGAAGPELFVSCPTVPSVGVPAPEPPSANERVVVINEIDYDQLGPDADGFVELHNNGPTEVNLAGLALVLVDGTAGAEYARENLGGTLAAGAYHVVSIDAQNGAADGVALLDTASGELLDALSYEGTLTSVTIDGATYSLVEGTALPTLVADSNTVNGSLIRHPDGTDTNDAASDWAFTTIPTPGAANALSP